LEIGSAESKQNSKAKYNPARCVIDDTYDRGSIHGRKFYEEQNFN
jgi:hypothetical protein